MKNQRRLVYADEVEYLINSLDSLPWEEDVHTLVNSLSTVDVVEVVHGRWIYEPVEFTYEKDIKCSICGDYVEHATIYCPNCGAKMDGERSGGQ
jgi:hypothetical protein